MGEMSATHCLNGARGRSLAFCQGREACGLGERVKLEICQKRGWRLCGVGMFGVIACAQEVAGTPGELLADAEAMGRGETLKS